MTSDDTHETVTSDPVGEQLRRAREKLGLSVSQIADAQHLRNGIIQAIENGDYGQIGSELFLKGYVRAYARQVELDANDIIDDLNRELEPARLQKARELEANPLLDMERRRRRKRRIAKVLLMITALVVIVAIAVVLILPRLGFNGAEAQAPAATEPSEQSSTAPEQASDHQTAERPASLGVDAEAAYGDEPVPEEESDGLLEDDSGLLADTEPTASASDTIEDRVPVVSQTTERALTRSGTSSEDAVTSGRLVITFTGECWVQVRDATGSSLASALKRAGDRLDVSGKAPLKVVIGAVDTVGDIRFQGEPVDIDDFPVTNNRSEFTLSI